MSIQEGQVFFCGMKYREEDFMVPDGDEVAEVARDPPHTLWWRRG